MHNKNRPLVFVGKSQDCLSIKCVCPGHFPCVPKEKSSHVFPLMRVTLTAAAVPRPGTCFGRKRDIKRSLKSSAECLTKSIIEADFRAPFIATSGFTSFSPCRLANTSDPTGFVFAITPSIASLSAQRQQQPRPNPKTNSFRFAGDYVARGCRGIVLSDGREKREKGGRVQCRNTGRPVSVGTRVRVEEQGAEARRMG